MKHRQFSTFVLRAVIVMGCLVVALSGCRGAETSTRGEATPQPAQALPYSEHSDTGTATAVNALGTIRPAQTLQIGFAASGPLSTLTVRVGQRVGAGKMLAELDPTALELELASAKAAVAFQQAALDALLRGPDAALVEQAEAEHAQQVALAEVELQMAQLQVEQAHIEEQAGLQEHAPAVALARSKVEQLDLQVAQARANPPAADVVAAQVNLARAQDAVDEARIAYQKALDRSWEPQEVRDGLAKALWRAELGLTLAQARLDGALVAQQAHAIGVEALISQRVAAEEQLTQTLSSGLPYTVTFALLQAEVERALLQLDGLRSWQNPHLRAPHPEEIAQARALLRQAELVVEQLAWRLKGAQLRAPFDGVVSEVYSRPGEWCTAGAPVVALVDTGHWYVETRNVGELIIGQVSVGQEAKVQVMAVGGTELHGQVETISPVAVVQQGDTTYTLIIALEPTDLALWPGMNAKVEIRTD